jgi:hypothetical protein
MYIIGAASAYLFTFLFYIFLFYLFSLLVKENSYLMVLSFSLILLYGIYAFQKSPILHESFLNYYQYPSSLYNNLMDSISRHSKFNPNNNYVLYGTEKKSYLEDETQYNFLGSVLHKG